jgi:hypothetical protein
VSGPVDLDEVVVVDEKDIAEKEFERLLEEERQIEEEVVAMRYNEGKPQLGYLLHYPHALEALVKVLEQGAVKYEALNWKKGNKPDSEYLDACMRHLFKHLTEGPHDADIGVMHLAQAVWNLLTLIELNMQDVPTLNPDFDQDEFVSRYS